MRSRASGAHPLAPRGVVEQLGHAAPEAVGVAGRGVQRAVAGRHARLGQRVGGHGAPEGHVLGDLDHGRDVVERARRIRRQADVRRGEDQADVVVAAPAGELDVVAQRQLVGQRAHGGQRVAVADEDRVPVVAHGPQRGERPQRVVDAVLRAHDPEVGDQVGAPAAPARGRPAPGESASGRARCARRRRPRDPCRRARRRPGRRSRWWPARRRPSGRRRARRAASRGSRGPRRARSASGRARAPGRGGRR